MQQSIRQKALKRAMLTRVLSPTIDQQKTHLELPAVHTVLTGSFLPVDTLGRPYLQINASEQQTLLLIIDAVQRFKRLSGKYPAEICLSAHRFLTYGQPWRVYNIDNLQIPLRYEGDEQGDVSYAVLVRGVKPFDGN